MAGVAVVVPRSDAGCGSREVIAGCGSAGIARSRTQSRPTPPLLPLNVTVRGVMSALACVVSDQGKQR